MRASPALSLLALTCLGVGLGGCGAGETPEAKIEGASSGGLDSAAALAEPLLTQIDVRAPYAGEWAAEHSHCVDGKKRWTIEPHRMAIVPAMRFCAFDSVYVNREADAGESSWSAGATCLADGRESRDFLFFRVKENLREMRVTFNDSRSVQLYRCLS